MTTPPVMHDATPARWCRLWVIVGILSAVAASLTVGAELTVKSGTVYRGTIANEDAESVTLEYAGVQLRILKADITRLDRGAALPTAATGEPTTAATGESSCPGLLPVLAPPGTPLVVNTGQLNLRAGPGTQFVRTGSVPQGTVLFAAEEQNGWYALCPISPATGWVIGRFVERLTARPARVTAPRVVIQERPVPGSRALGQVAEDDEVLALREEASWTLIAGPFGVTGWVPSDTIAAGTSETVGAPLRETTIAAGNRPVAAAVYDATARVLQVRDSALVCRHRCVLLAVVPAPLRRAIPAERPPVSAAELQIVTRLVTGAALRDRRLYPARQAADWGWPAALTGEGAVVVVSVLRGEPVSGVWEFPVEIVAPQPPGTSWWVVVQQGPARGNLQALNVADRD